MRLTDRTYTLSEEGLKNRISGQYYRGQATKAKLKNIKYILNKLGVRPTQRMSYFILKRLNTDV